MTVDLPLSIYTMQSISAGRKAFKQFLQIDVNRDKNMACLTIRIADEYNKDEQKEIVNSFLNYLLQCSATQNPVDKGQ